MAKNQHVVPEGKGWAVKGEGNHKATSVHATQKDAIDAARNIARNQKSEVVIHRRDGTIRDKDSYGKDPSPPRDLMDRKRATIKAKLRQPVSGEYHTHVIPQQGSWAVKKEGADRATSIHKTKDEAISKAKELARSSHGSSVIVHSSTGAISATYKYGNQKRRTRTK